MTTYCKNIFVILFVLFGVSIQAQLKDIPEMDDDFENTPSEYKELIVNVLDKEEKSNFYSDNYSKGIQYFFIEKYYLEDKFGVEVYLFGARASHAKIYIMFSHDEDVRALDFMHCEEEWQTIIDFINKYVDECNKIPFLNETLKIMKHTIDHNKFVPKLLYNISENNN